MEDPAARRVDYGLRHFVEDDVAATPLAQFQRWYSDAVEAAVVEPNAMVLGVVDTGGVSTRTVLLKSVDGRGFVFYTNLGSRKALAIAHDPRVSLLFGWYGLHRQVAVRGRAEEVPRAETQAYFRSRPHSSRIGAWASTQSAAVASADDLDARFAALRERWPDTGSPDDVPVPEHWGGFLVRATEVEFWQGRTSRLHDRLVFSGGGPLDEAAGWTLGRRQP